MIMRLALLAIPLVLTGCNQPSQKAAPTADGEILPGSASDAMLPLDTVRSQAPLAPKPVEADRSQTNSTRAAAAAVRSTSAAPANPATSAAPPQQTDAEPSAE